MAENAKSLAIDIQTNVDAVLKDPNNQGALDALHKDSRLLDGHLSGSGLIDHNMRLQEATQNELNTLEKNGALPKITIDESGQIEAGKSFTQVLADPRKDTLVWTARPESKM